jgi:hypothetical protein
MSGNDHPVLLIVLVLVLEEIASGAMITKWDQ